MTIEIKGEQETDMTEIETLRAEREATKIALTEMTKIVCDRLQATDDKIAALEAAAPKPWPQVGDQYWAIDTWGKIIDCAAFAGNETFRNGTLSIGNIFPTKDAAEMERDRRRVAAIMREMADGGSWALVISCERSCVYPSAPNSCEFYSFRFSSRVRVMDCRERIVTDLSNGGTRDGMARLLEIWGRR